MFATHKFNSGTQDLMVELEFAIQTSMPKETDSSDRSLLIMVTLVSWSKVTVNDFVNRHTTGTPLPYTAVYITRPSQPAHKA